MKTIKTIDDLIRAAGQGSHAEKYGKDNYLETKANENIDITQNANWYSATGLQNDIKDLTPKYGSLLALLNEGFEGNSLADTFDVPFNITDYFMQGRGDWTDEAKPAFDAQQVTDSKSTITQVNLKLEMNVTDNMLDGSTDRQLFEKIRNMLAKSYARTAESMIINGDNDTAATGNVNSDDQAPATTFASSGGAQDHRIKIDHGIRETAINGTSLTLDIGAFDSDDMQGVRQLIAERYMDRDEDLLYIFNPTTYLEAMTDDAFKLMVNNSRPALEGGKPGAWGVQIISNMAVPKTEADGKMSATAANNTLGQFLLCYKPAIRWGLGRDFAIEVERVAGYGFHLFASVKFGFVILDRANNCALGRNMTV